MGALPRKRSIRVCFTGRAPLAMLTGRYNVAPLLFPPRVSLSPCIRHRIESTGLQCVPSRLAGSRISLESGIVAI